MSEEMARRKREEAEALAAEEARLIASMEKDCCPKCGKFTKTFEYVMMFPAPFGWIECPACGTVFSPESIRAQKLEQFGVNRPAPPTE
jgi:hypothetical protein